MTTRGAPAVSDFREQASALERDLQGLEVSRRNIELVGRDDRFTRFWSVAFGDDDAAAASQLNGR